MRAPRAWPLVRPMFPGPWLSMLGVVLCLAVSCLLAFAGRLPDGDAPMFFLQGAALVAGGWWLLMASPLCLMACRMAPLRLPGVGRMLRRGGLLHLALSIGLPWLVLCQWLPPGVDAAALAGALWLGSATGLLIISMPMALPLVPLCIIVADGAVLRDPAWCGLLGAVALGLSVLAWRWQLGRTRSVLWAPAGVALAGSPLELARLVQQLPGERRGATRRPAPAAGLQGPETGRDLLAAFLGPACQTLRQLYGRRGRWLVYLVFAGVSLALLGGAALWPPEAAGVNVFLAAVMGVILQFVMMGPATRLAALQRPGLAGLAELQLTPGMPAAAQLPAALMRQMLYCLAERLLLLALVLPTAVGLCYALRLPWLWCWAWLVVLALLQGMATAWLALRGRHRSGWWLGTLSLGSMLAIGTNAQVLVHGRPLTGPWLVSWAAWMVLAGMVFWTLARREVHGAAGLAGRPAH